MAKLVTKFKYLNAKKAEHRGRYAKYIATREGVEKIDDTFKTTPATLRQKELVTKLLEDFPECMDMLEYEDFIAVPTIANASDFISRAVEENYESLTNKKTYADYIATRPRAQRFGSHGLFSDEGKPIILSKVSEELNQYNGKMWTTIISLHREDAERLGFDNGERWRNLLRAHKQELSSCFRIPMEDIRWYAAFHNESHHPHCHLIVYSKHSNQGYLDREGVLSLRSTLAREIFAQDLLCEYEKQTEHRDELRSFSRDLVSQIISQINTGTYENLVLEEKLMTLANQLSKLKGKKVYGYLPSDVKETVDSVVNELEKDEKIAALYDQWYLRKEYIIRTYTDSIPERIPLRDNTEFKPIKNAIIQEAMNIVLDRSTVEESTEDDNPIPEPPPESETEAEEVEPPKTNGEYLQLLRRAKAGNKWAQYGLAKKLLEKDSEHHDTGAAVEWLIKSAEQGYTVAKYKLGRMFLHGDQVQKNIPYALRWLEDAVADQNQYAEYLLGKILLRGDEVEQDVLRGEALLRRSASKHNRFAQYALGKALLDGNLLLQDIPEAIMQIKAAADQGFPVAQYVFGKMLYQGELLPKDILGSLDYLESAAAKKNAYAAYLAAKIRLSEEGYKDIAKIIRGFEIAAENGNDFAEYQLGKLYLFGKEVDQDREKAISYLVQAAEHGNQYAAQLLKSIQSNRNWSVALGSLRLLQAISRIFQRKMEDERRNSGAYVDRKLRRKIEEKKQAHGLKSG